MPTEDYYNLIADGYDELHKEEQEKKLEIIKKELEIKPETKLLDVGCGTGISSNFKCDVTGIDPSEELLKIACEKFPKSQFMKCNAESIPFADKSFDVVISLTSIQNFTDIEKGLSEIKRVGTNQFALSFLKKSEKTEKIEKLIKTNFPNAKRIDEEKDIIFINKQ